MGSGSTQLSFCSRMIFQLKLAFMGHARVLQGRQRLQQRLRDKLHCPAVLGHRRERDLLRGLSLLCIFSFTRHKEERIQSGLLWTCSGPLLSLFLLLSLL